MTTSFAMHSAQIYVKQLPTAPTTKAPIECTCGAQAFRDNRTIDRQQRQLKRVTPTGGKQPSTKQEISSSLRSAKQRATQPQDDPDDETTTPTTRTRSLWRKLLGKGPKCICEKLQREREARRLQPIAIPSEYNGCVTVRVAGKQVAYTREMQLIKRRSYTPLDAISEDEDCNAQL